MHRFLKINAAFLVIRSRCRRYGHAGFMRYSFDGLVEKILDGLLLQTG